ncbi:hypothetical protein [Haloplasma contractile]|uniref:Uncharacterized protein n=1 Tax=Haloplasma contractile SSD-17B TaxID=1033810 RepID=U2DRH5_9MOLU|nr:hypothetical protein [Haloplasma contractile]ERJ11177.1 hypothetical protein HLPCO_002746 [Haloplasma contractile SSD-17B]
MLDKPVIHLSENKGDFDYILNLCTNALVNKGQELNREADYQQAIDSMKDRISQSHSFERTLYILMDYCILK